MNALPAMLAAEMAITQQAVAMEVLKQAADMQQKMADMLQASVDNVPMSSTRGLAVNIAA